MVEYNHSTLDKKLLHIPFIITFYGSLNSLTDYIATYSIHCIIHCCVFAPGLDIF